MTKPLKNQCREKLKAEYRVFLCRQKGLSEGTIYRCCTFVDRFLNFKFGESPDDLSKITGHDITNFLLQLTGSKQPFRDKTVASTMLRSFFRFLFQSEKIKSNLALGIPNVSQKYARRIPYHLTPDQVEELMPYASTGEALIKILSQSGAA